MRQVLLFLIVFLPVFATAQSVVCNENGCGTVDPGWRLQNSESIVCEGTPFLLVGDESTPLDSIQRYRWIIQDVDGSIILDTSFSDLTPLEFLYVNPNDTTCIGRDEIDILVTLQASFVCTEGESCRSSTEPLKIILLPRAEFRPLSEACIESSIRFVNESCYANEYEWDFGDGTSSTEESPTHTYSQRGNYTVRLQVSNQCGTNVITKTVRVVEQPMAGSDFNQDTVIICIPETVTLSDASNRDSRTRWEISPPIFPDSAWCLVDTNQTLGNDNLDIIFKKQGDFEVKVVAQNACGVDEQITTIRAVDQPNAILTKPPQFCETAMYTPEVSYNNQTGISGVEWSFEGATPSTSQDLHPSNISFEAIGEYEVTLIIRSQCGDRTYRTTVNVLPRIEPEIVASKSVFCRNDSPDTLVVNVAGGLWEGEGIVDRDLGVFDPSAVGEAGQFVIRYVVAGSDCAGDDEVMLEVRDAPHVNIQNASFCVDDIPMQLISDLDGGVWTGNGISPSGLFDPSEAEVGLNSITYTVSAANGCDAIALSEILVEAKPILILPANLELCRTTDNINLNEVLALDPAGTTLEWSGNGVTDVRGIFNGEDLSEDTIVLELVQRTQLCDSLRHLTVILIDQLQLSITPDTSICVGENSLELKSNINGGRWLGPSIDPITGIIDLTGGLNGPQQYEYIVNQGSSCEQSQSSIIDIIDLGLNLTAGDIQEACVGDGIVTLQGASPSGGTWRGQGLIDVDLGTVDLEMLNNIDTIFFEYCIERQSELRCEACTRKMLIVNDLPTIGIDLNPEFCIGSEYQFEDTTAQDYNYSWDFDAFGLSNQNNPAITIDTAGVFQYEVVVSNRANCELSVQGQLSVVDAPIASFELESDEGCAPFLIDLTDLSTGQDIQRSWTLDDRVISDEDIQGFIIEDLLVDSIFTLTQIVGNGCGERIAETDIQVFAEAQSSIGVNVDEGCSPLNIEIGNASQGNPESYIWNYGNGQTSNEESPLQPTYINNTDTPQQYDISLIVSNNCATDTAVQSITVNPPNVEAFIQLDTLSACPPFQLQLQNFSTAGSTVQWQWISESGQINTSVESNPLVTFVESGTYKIQLAASQCGTDIDSATIEVLDIPTADFSSPATICVQDSFTIENNSLDGLSTTWDLGDGNIANGYDVNHLYDSSGTYDVTLTVTNSDGCNDMMTKSVDVRAAPIINAEASSIVGCPPLRTTITTTGSSNLSYIWSTSEGQTSTESNPAFVFPNTGSYTVSGVSVDEFACRSEDYTEDIIVHPQPSASFELSNEDLCIGRDSIITNNLSHGATAYQWTLNNENMSSRENFSLAPSDIGMSELSLTVVNEFGCSHSMSQFIQVDEVPDLVLEFEMISFCENQEITINDIGSGAEFYNWMVSDGRESQAENLAISFANAGVYNLQIIGRNGASCIDTLSLDAFFQIYESPVADFRFIENPDPTLLGEVQFNSLSTNFTDLEWEFGDDSFSNQENPLHVYDINRPIEVIHRAINTNDGLQVCTDEKLAQISPEWLSTFYAPNALSPDSGSDKVRQFLPVGLGIASYDISIYSPWGEIIWYSTALEDGSPSEGWDGLLPNGEQAPQGVYIFKANITYESGDVVSERGPVHLIR